MIALRRAAGHAQQLVLDAGSDRHLYLRSKEAALPGPFYSLGQEPIHASANAESMSVFWPVAVDRSQLWITMSPMGIMRNPPAGIGPKGVSTVDDISMDLAVASTAAVLARKTASAPSVGIGSATENISLGSPGAPFNTLLANTATLRLWLINDCTFHSLQGVDELN